MPNANRLPLRAIQVSGFEFVSNFRFRVSNFLLHVSKPLHLARLRASFVIRHSSFVIFALSFLLSHPLVTRANVYPTNIRLNGGTTNLAVSSGASVTISYLLNESASAGVTVAIQSGSTVQRAINIASGPGTLKGTNSIVWDGRDDIGHAVAGGTYSVSITAAATGYTNWTQLNNDANSSIWEPVGIAVNKNTNSIYYGRIFVANSGEGFNPDTKPGDNVGIIKYNPDGSWADEGPLATGGYQWNHGQVIDDFSPWKIEIGSDDRVYINDFLYRVVLSFDQLISTNSRLLVLTTNNYPNSQSALDGLCLSGSATNMQLWMADSHADSGGLGVGIRRWDLTAGGVVAPNDTGITTVTNGPSSDLDQNPKDVALDRFGNIYTVQFIDFSGSPSSARLLKFAAYSSGVETNAMWKTNDSSLYGANGVAVDPTASYVAVAVQGSPNGIQYDNGALRIFACSNGAPVTTLTSGPHNHNDAAWDNVGNVYTCDGYDGVWRVYSPPGGNQSSTVAIPQIQIAQTYTQPTLGTPVYTNGQVTFTLSGQANVTYIIQISSDLYHWTSVATNSSVFAVRQITLPAPPSGSYFRAVVGPYIPASPLLTQPAVGVPGMQFTMIGEPYLTYVIQRSTNLVNWVPVLTNSSPNATNTFLLNSSVPNAFFRAKVGAP